MADESGDLVRRASQGDGVAKDELLERHLPGLRRYVQARMSLSLRAVESSSDVVQSVCREVLRDFEDFEYRGEGAFRNWLYQAALRKLVDHQRHHHAQKRDARLRTGAGPTSADFAVLASSVRSPSGDAILHEEVDALERGFSALEPDDQEILSLIYIEGLSHAQASGRLGCTEVASRKQLSRALARLARLIG